jgi:hypothetical protein
MLRASGFLLGSSLVLISACQRADDVDSASPDVAAGPPVISGTWLVEGLTVETASKKTRQISGRIILAEEGGKYRSTFDLDTSLPGATGPIRADVIGEGEGTVSGLTLSGTARTQVVVSAAPNVDPGFAFVPRQIGARIVSKTTATLGEDGTITIEIESEPAAGETYAATRTTLTGSFAPPPRTLSAP